MRVCKKGVALALVAIMLLGIATMAMAETTENAVKTIVINGETYQSASIIAGKTDVSLREDANTNAKRITKLQGGTEFGVKAVKGDYYQVCLKDGRVGFVAKEFVKLDGELVIAPTSNSTATGGTTGNTSSVQTVASAWTAPSDAPAPQITATEKELWDSIPSLIANAKAKNSDVNGWLRIPGTNISFPTVICNDNDYYLTRNAEKKKDDKGGMYFDYRNKLSSQQRHLILYGHNMQVSKTMLNNTLNYKDVNFYLKTPVIRVEAFGGSLWEIISCRRIQPTQTAVWKTLIKTKFNNDAEWLSYIQDIQRTSWQAGKVPEIPLRANDQILSLVTCDRSVTPKARFVTSFRKIA